MSSIKVSVVIPAFNEEKYIEQSLNSLLKSEQQTNIHYEVLLVDNNSTDNTAKIALRFKDGMNLRIIKEKKQGRGAARARGFKEAKGEIILSADADTIFYQGWIETLTSALGSKAIGVTTSGKIVDSSPLTNFLVTFFQPILMVLYRVAIGHYWLSGFSSGVLKSAYEKAGGFSTSLQAQEDLDLSFRIAKLGNIKFINKPVIFSGRRFKEGPFRGFYGYIKSFFEAFILKSNNTYLSNPR